MKTTERKEFEQWLGIAPTGAAHDLAWAAWKAHAALTAAPTPPAQSAQANPVLVQHRKPITGKDGETTGYTTWIDGPGLDWWPHRHLYACPAQQPAVPESADTTPPALHPDDAAVDRFAIAMKTKLAASRAKGRGGWDDPAQCSVEHLARLLVEHVAKGDPVDVANFAMMLHQRGADHAVLAAAQQPAVPEDVAREPMAEKWCWWIGDAETFHVADTESEAHSEAQSRIDDDCEPGGTHEYSVGRVQHPIDALGMEWLAEHAAETIEENACCWCDDNTGAEDPSITLAAEDKQALGTMVAAFLREKAAAHWWTADQKTITTHTHVAGSAEGGDAARAAEKGGE